MMAFHVHGVTFCVCRRMVRGVCGCAGGVLPPQPFAALAAPRGRGYAPLPSDSYPRQAELAGCLLRAARTCALRAVFCAGARSRTPCALRAVFVLSQADVSALRAAAEAGDAGAQCRLGVLYARGEGVARDAAEGAGWLRKAAEQGHAGAQCNLGLLCLKGLGVARDAAEAARWLRRAAERGNAEAQYQLGVLKMKGQGVELDEAGAVRLLRLSAEQGYANAQYDLGLLYARGQGVETDAAEAVFWFHKAGDQGHKGALEALRDLGELY